MSTASPNLRFAPAAPRTLEEADLPAGLVMDIVVRRLYQDGVSGVFRLCETLSLPHRIVDQVFSHLKQQQLVEVKGVLGEDYSFSLTAAGRQLANERFQVCQYSGPVPVSLRDYHHAVVAQAAHVKINRRSLADK